MDLYLFIWLFWCMHVCTCLCCRCMHVWVWIYILMCTYVEARGPCKVSSSLAVFWGGTHSLVAQEFQRVSSWLIGAWGWWSITQQVQSFPISFTQLQERPCKVYHEELLTTHVEWFQHYIMYAYWESHITSLMSIFSFYMHHLNLIFKKNEERKKLILPST